MANEKELQVLRTLDKADRLPAPEVFDLLTTGRTDTSGDVTPGCGLTRAQAAVLAAVTFAGKEPRILSRFRAIEALESAVVDAATGRTAWDQLLEWYAAMPAPKNIAWLLDDLIDATRKA